MTIDKPLSERDKDRILQKLEGFLDEIELEKKRGALGKGAPG